jgi:hypothetical protein
MSNAIEVPITDFFDQPLNVGAEVLISASTTKAGGPGLATGRVVEVTWFLTDAHREESERLGTQPTHGYVMAEVEIQDDPSKPRYSKKVRTEHLLLSSRNVVKFAVEAD